MTTKIWTTATHHAMFSMIGKIEINGKIVGPYYNSFKRGLKRFTSKEKDQIVGKLYNDPDFKKTFESKLPKSPIALLQQINWCITKQELNPGQFEMVNRLRLIAYSAGWLRMMDIIELEEQNFLISTNLVSKNQITCPKCQSKKIIPIEYGYPSHEMWEEYELGKIAIGGCVLTSGSPDWQCQNCKHEWGNKDPFSDRYSDDVESTNDF